MVADLSSGSKADEQNEREVDSFEEELTKRDGGT